MDGVRPLTSRMVDMFAKPKLPSTRAVHLICLGGDSDPAVTGCPGNASSVCRRVGSFATSSADRKRWPLMTKIVLDAWRLQPRSNSVEEFVFLGSVGVFILDSFTSFGYLQDKGSFGSDVTASVVVIISLMLCAIYPATGGVTLFAAITISNSLGYEIGLIGLAIYIVTAD